MLPCIPVLASDLLALRLRNSARVFAMQPTERANPLSVPTILSIYTNFKRSGAVRERNQHTTEYEWDYDEIRGAVVAYAEEHGCPPTTDDAANDDRFPSLSTLYRYLDCSWNELLEDAGFDEGHVGSYDSEERAEMLRDMRAVLQSVDSEYLTTRRYAERGKYGDDTIKQTFGSWTEACEQARIEPGQKYGVASGEPTGERLDSLLELRVAQFLYGRGIDYDVRPELEGTGWRGDFYLPEFDLWVEVNGFAEGERPNEEDFARKLEHYDRSEMDCVLVQVPEELVGELRTRGASVPPVE